MTDPEDFDDDNTDDETPAIRKLRAENKRLSKELAKSADASERVAAAERRAAFAEAGIPTGGLAEYFRKGYDGEMTAEAIVKAATDAGLVKAAEQAEDPDRAAHERVEKASAGADLPDRIAEYDAELALAKTQEQALAVMRRHGVEIAGDND